jgi:hypothetical protein
MIWMPAKNEQSRQVSPSFWKGGSFQDEESVEEIPTPNPSIMNTFGIINTNNVQSMNSSYMRRKYAEAEESIQAYQVIV